MDARPLAHLRVIGHGERGWNAPRYGLRGQTRALSSYDQLEAPTDTDFHTSVSGGIVSTFGRQPIAEPTTTRRGRVSAQYDSAPNAGIFQGYFATGWSGPYAFGGILENPIIRPPHTPLASAFNPNMPGSKEPQRATRYVPWPASGDIYPKAI